MNLLPVFQSTPSMRTATKDGVYALADSGISIHAVHADGDGTLFWNALDTLQISIHAVHADGDHSMP